MNNFLPNHQYLFLNDLKAKYQTFCLEEVPNVVPCSDDDISKLEQQFSCRLPLAYREFLLWMGRGGSFIEKDHLYDSLPFLNEYARKTLAQKRSDLNLPPDTFVFAMDMSESFYFFRCIEGDNPPIYIFMDEAEQNYIRGEKKLEQFSPEWAFLFHEPKKDFGIFSKSFVQYLNYWLDVHIRAKERAKYWEQKRLKRMRGNT
jgi:hypothetical protein